MAGFPQSRLEKGGLKIYTTLNPAIQNRVQAAMPFGTWANRKSVAVTDIIDPKNGNRAGLRRQPEVRETTRRTRTSPRTR